MSQSNVPIKSFRAGNIEASIWKSQHDKDGHNVVRYSVQIQKKYRKKNGDYEPTKTFFPDELPKLATIAQKAYEYISVRESTETE